MFFLLKKNLSSATRRPPLHGGVFRYGVFRLRPAIAPGGGGAAEAHDERKRKKEKIKNKNEAVFNAFHSFLLS